MGQNEVEGQLQQQPPPTPFPPPPAPATLALSNCRFCWTRPRNRLGMELILIPKGLTHPWHPWAGGSFVCGTVPVISQNSD